MKAWSISTGPAKIVFGAALVMVAAGWATGANQVPPNDGLTEQQRRTLQEMITEYGEAGGGARDMVIVSTKDPHVLFAMYRASQMTGQGWDLYSRTVDWANNFNDRATTKVFLATYNGTLDPDFSAERDGIAVRDYLINTMGFSAANISVFHQSALESTSDYSAWDLVIYAWTFPRSAQNVINSGKPFVTASVGQGDELDIGNGVLTMHESRNTGYVHDNSHYITQTYPLGPFVLPANMFMDATDARGSGQVLVAADPLVVSETICPDDAADFTRLLGGTPSGDALDTCVSDDTYLSVPNLLPFSPLFPFIKLQIWAHSSFNGATVTSIDYEIEQTVTAVVPGGQDPATMVTSIQNYTTNAFEVVDTRAGDPFADIVVTHTQSTNPANYIQAGDGEIRIMTDVFDPGDALNAGWGLRVDLYSVTVNR